MYITVTFEWISFVGKLSGNVKTNSNKYFARTLRETKLIVSRKCASRIFENLKNLEKKLESR